MTVNTPSLAHRAAEHFGGIDQVLSLVDAVEPFLLSLPLRQQMVHDGVDLTPNGQALLERMMTLEHIQARVNIQGDEGSLPVWRTGEVISIWSEQVLEVRSTPMGGEFMLHELGTRWVLMAEVLIQGRHQYCGEVAVIY